MLIYDHGDIQEILFIAEFLGIITKDIKEGLLYLGFHLKATTLRIVDWIWMTEKFKSIIQRWKNRWLSLGGRYTLVMLVLSQFVVYWAHIFYIPKFIVGKFKAIIAQFIWSGSMDKRKIHLVGIEGVSIPKKYGSWGMLNIIVFNKTMLTKSLWRGINGTGTWSSVIKCKYGRNLSLLEIYRSKRLFASSVLEIWRGFTKITMDLAERLCWRFGMGLDIMLAGDRIQGVAVLPLENSNPIHRLENRHIFLLYQTIERWSMGFPIWNIGSSLVYIKQKQRSGI